jgi:indolepyruvate ferredoxin oxidoreductase beta subunit
MTLHNSFTSRDLDPSLGGIIKLAVMAVGGQGGGVLGSWIEDLARSNGYVAQATSVAGVAQRTGSTIYYVEMAPKCERQPVFSLMPAAGDVDVLVAAEMMEAGRAILRGFVTPDRTTLIASTHRALAVSEKVVPGDGIASSDEVRAAIAIAAQRSVLFDMDRVAIDNGSVISPACLVRSPDRARFRFLGRHLQQRSAHLARAWTLLCGLSMRPPIWLSRPHFH